MPISNVPDKIYMHPNCTEMIKLTGLYYLDPSDPLEVKHYFDGTSTVTATLKDQYGNAIPGCTNISLSCIDAVTGTFTGVTGAGFAPAVGTGYTLVVSASQGAATRQWNIDTEITLG